MMDWKERLRIECNLSSQTKVAEILGVSLPLINKIVHDKYPARNSKVESLVRARLNFNDVEDLQENQEKSKPESSEDWIEGLKKMCDKYSALMISRYLDVSPSAIYSILNGRYTSNTKIKDKFLLKIGTKEVLEISEECLPFRRKRPRTKSQINKTQKLILDVIDAIFCAEVILYDDLLEKFPRYSLSRSLNYLMREGFIDLVMVESSLHGAGRKVDKKAYKLRCGCLAPGISTACKTCPLGKEMIRLEQCDEEQEEEDFEDAC